MAFLQCAPYSTKVNLIGSLSAHIFQGHSSAASLRAKPSPFAASLATISLPGLFRRKSSICNSHFFFSILGFSIAPNVLPVADVAPAERAYPSRRRGYAGGRNVGERNERQRVKRTPTKEPSSARRLRSCNCAVRRWSFSGVLQISPFAKDGERRFP